MNTIVDKFIIDMIDRKLALKLKWVSSINRTEIISCHGCNVQLLA